MSRSPRLLGTCALLSASVVLGACSSDGRTKYTPEGKTRLTAIAGELAAKAPGTCTDMKPYPEAEYFQTRVIYDLIRAQAAGECSGFAQALEITVLQNTSERDRYVLEFNNFICSQSRKVKVGTPGLPWVLGTDYTIRPDDDAGARKAAKALGLEYRFTACPGVEHPNWTERSVNAAEALGTRITTALPGECADFELADYDLTRNEPQIRRLGIPPGMGLCTIGTQPAVLAAFAESFEIPKDTFIPAEYSVLCSKGQPVQVVAGKDWAVFTAASMPVVRALSKALDGAVATPDAPCGASGTATSVAATPSTATGLNG